MEPLSKIPPKTAQQLEREFWQSLETAAQFPETADLRSLGQALEKTLSQQSLTEQLSIAGEGLMQLSDLYAARAERLISGWERRYNPIEPVVNLESCGDLFVQSLSLDVSELFAEPESVQYPAHRKQKLFNPAEDSIIAEVDKDRLLTWVDQMSAAQSLDEAQMAEQIWDLAHEENVEEWSRAIAQYLQQLDSNICLPDLQQALDLPIVELWLGLLMGEFTLDPQGDFYDAQNLWIMHSYVD